MKRRYNIIITGADKGGAIVIQDVKLYIREAERQLNKTKNYRPLPHDPTKINNDLVKKAIKRFYKEHLIKGKVAKGLVIQKTKEYHVFIQSPKS